MTQFADRVEQTTTTTGTGDLTLIAPVSNYQPFSTPFALNQRVSYVIEDSVNNVWEAGVGYLSASGIFVRETITANSSGTTVALSLASGTKRIFNAPTANSLNFAQKKGTDVASAATTPIWEIGGQTVHVTGSVTATSLGTAPNAGATRRVINDAEWTLTNGANLVIQGGANVTLPANSSFIAYAETTTQIKVFIESYGDGLLVRPQTGTWTVTLADAASGGNESSTTTTGYYTKIGDIVHCSFSLGSISTAGMTGVNILNISLPFTSAAAGGISCGTVIADNINTVGTDIRQQLSCRVADGGSTAILRATGDDRTDQTVTVGDLTSGSSDISAFQLTYRTDA